MELNPAYVRFANALKEFFRVQAGDNELAMLILAPCLFVAIYLFLTLFVQPHKKFQVQEKDLEFFDQVIAQKGLEDFDRNLLIEVAETFHVNPMYRLLLEEELFRKLLIRIKEGSAIKTETTTRLKSKVDYLRKLQGKLFLGT